MLEITQVKRFLDMVKEIKQSYTLIDSHIHPFDVMSNNYIYKKNGEQIYSRNIHPYPPPKIGQIRSVQKLEDKCKSIDPTIREKMALLTCNRLYNHTGPRVFKDHMNLSGIDKALLLPVMGPAESGDTQIEILSSMFGHDERFAVGYCLSNSIADEDINKTIKRAKQKFNIKVIKIHPNITGIDISMDAGKKRINHMIEASKKNHLKLVIHGGRSYCLKDKATEEYSIIENLMDIDWGITNQTVVIAHAGMYGYEQGTIKHNILVKLNRLISSYENLFVDISGLDIDQMIPVLRHIDLKRVIFGSDALYSPQWSAVVKTIFCLAQIDQRYQENFVDIFSKTPETYFAVH